MIDRLREVWYGQRPLGETYWLWGFLISGVVTWVLLFIAYVAVTGIHSTYPFYAYLALQIPFSIFIWVALWRSATENPGFWAAVVKVLVVIGGVFAVYGWIQLLLTGHNSLTDTYMPHTH